MQLLMRSGEPSLHCGSVIHNVRRIDVVRFVGAPVGVADATILQDVRMLAVTAALREERMQGLEAENALIAPWRFFIHLLHARSVTLSLMRCTTAEETTATL